MAKILVIEDDNLLQRLYEGKLTDEGFKVVVAPDGKEGLNLAKSDGFDLIILDIMLPGGINGFDVLEALKKNRSLQAVPVIVLTNLESEEEVAREIGAIEFYKKTKVTPDQIVSRIKEILKEKS